MRGEYAQAGTSLSHEGGKGAGFWSFWLLFVPVAWHLLVIVTRCLQNFVMKWLSCLFY